MKRLYNILFLVLKCLPVSFSMRLYRLYVLRYGNVARYIRTATMARITNGGIDRTINIAPGVIFNDANLLKIGRNTTVNERCFISAYGGVTIGNNVSIGHDTTILSSDHIFQDVNRLIKEQGIEARSTIIGDDVYIGCKCIILGGIHIGRGSIIGAGSVVTRDVDT